ncbi:glycosyl hydrolase family protein [Stylonychia lemnae]|uniref:Glycosyl hydrolase family protein n=1 Tax=Stylonychia lemnae TaxID=5949 RepID=A0A078AI84_STYLE|nr:glycosyl hydrolase family protein [Stylonychia lemnae]|eukprot:CDW81975.1 glycosyl hydrolase family protein [Stylonychia lemnae]
MKALDGNLKANQIYTRDIALKIIHTKIETYQKIKDMVLEELKINKKYGYYFKICLQMISEMSNNLGDKNTSWIINKYFLNIFDSIEAILKLTSVELKTIEILDILLLPILENELFRMTLIQLLDQNKDLKVEQVQENLDQQQSLDYVEISYQMLINRPRAIQILHQRLSLQGQQSHYGIVDFINELPTLTWKAKGTLVLVMLGGISDITTRYLLNNNLYQFFQQSLNLFQRPNSIKEIEFRIRTKYQNQAFFNKEDYTSCRLSDFPENFAFGVATAAYQIEGAARIEGRGPSIWDDFCKIEGKINNDDNGDVADDFYHRYKQDIQMMKSLGIRHFRMSISWSRILPQGTIDSINQKGIDFYHEIFDSLIEAGIQPWVSLYHWDLPSALYGRGSNDAWLGQKIINQFNEYADLCFKTFGQKVKRWITFNEPHTFIWFGYGLGIHAPGRCTQGVKRDDCEQVRGGGNSSTEPYIVAHNVIIAHATAVKTYRDKYQKEQIGMIGWALSSDYNEPFDLENPQDVEAGNTQILFQFGWFMDPTVFGKYPDNMTNQISENRLPSFTEQEFQIIKGSYDFIGINHYTSRYITTQSQAGNDWESDSMIKQSTTNKEGKIIGPSGDSDWLLVYPLGLRKLLKWINNRYSTIDQPNPQICVFENGVTVPGESKKSLEDAVHDQFRVEYYKGYISNLRDAIVLDGINVISYFAWSLIDNFEWSNGYSMRFGLVYVDYKDSQTRYVKDSALWYSLFIQTLNLNSVVPQLTLEQRIIIPMQNEQQFGVIKII